MKVIELLNKIANGEEVPKKIKYGSRIYEYKEDNESFLSYYSQTGGNLFMNYVLDAGRLNDEVEIIEDTPKDAIFTLKGTPNSIRKSIGLPLKEDKKIEKLEHWVDVKSWVKGNDLEKGLEEQSEFNKNIYYKINEIIDYLNNKENK